jgi:hypothetical protein
VNTAVLILLTAGLAASAIALVLDIRAHSARRSGSPQSSSRSAVLYTAAVVATASVVAALACSRLDPSDEAAAPLGHLLTTALALALATVGGGPFAVLALRLATRGTSRAGVHGGILITENEPQRNEQQRIDRPRAAKPPRFGIFRRRISGDYRTPAASPPPESSAPAMGSAAVEVLRGGTTIGILERIAIAGAIVAGFPEAAAVVIAIKGVGRFSELAAPEAKERFIIGTLASFVWASACALVLR